MSDPSARAIYHDGRTAVRHLVTIQITGDRLLIVAADGMTISAWPLSEVRAVDPPRRLPLRLVWPANPAARLVIEDEAFAVRLRAEAPDLACPAAGHLGRGLGWAVVGMAIAGLLSLALPAVPRAIAPLVPLAWEEVLGDAVLAAVVPDLAGRAERCVEPAGVAALSMLTDRLALATAGSYRFRVVAVRAAMVNALALPGGRIVVFDGLIEAAESPDEIAGVLAHEIAHSMHRHPTQAVLRALGIEVLLKVAAGGSDLLEGAGRAAAFLAQMSYSREAEAEADAGAAEILTAAGISSGGLASFFRRLAEKRTDKHLPTYLDSHPPLEERAVRAATSTRAGDRGLDEDRWSDLRGICRAVAPLAVD